MSTPETTTGVTKIMATLTRGRVYMLMERGEAIIFENGVSREVTAEQREYLKENALDIVSVEGEAEHQPRQKFKFTEVSTAVAASDTTDLAEEASTRRGRSRA